MTSDVACLFVFLFAIYISSLIRHLCSDLLPIFLIGSFVFLLRVKNSYYILDTNPLSYILANNSPVCDMPFILLIVSFTKHRFLFLIKSNLTNFFFHGSCFWCCIYNYQTQGHRFSPIFLQNFHGFVFYREICDPF